MNHIKTSNSTKFPASILLYGNESLRELCAVWTPSSFITFKFEWMFPGSYIMRKGKEEFLIDHPYITVYISSTSLL